MPDEFDPFKPGTGRKDDFDATITDALFDVVDGRGTIKFDLACDDGEPYSVTYSIGSYWETYDGGLTVKHPNGDRTAFSNTSSYSDFMVHAMESGAKEEMYRINKVYENRGPANAKMWVGFRFHFDVLQRPVRRPLDNADGSPMLDEGGKRVWGNAMTDRTLPTKFLGVEGQQTLSMPTPSTGGASAPSADPLDVLDAVTKAKVYKTAKDAGSYHDFVEEMLQLTDTDGVAILEHDEIGQVLGNEPWYHDLHDS